MQRWYFHNGISGVRKINNGTGATHLTIPLTSFIRNLLSPRRQKILPGHHTPAGLLLKIHSKQLFTQRRNDATRILKPENRFLV